MPQKSRRRAGQQGPLCGPVPWPWLGLLGLWLLFGAGATVPAAEGPASGYAEGGTERCLYCHSGEHITQIAQTPHGNTADSNSPYGQQGCESCHGPGAQHAQRSRRAGEWAPMIGFGQDAGTPFPVQAGACLECHTKPLGDVEGMEWEGSVHGSEDMACSACHQVHQVNEQLAERDYQAQTCYGCHTETEARHPRFKGQGIVFEKLNCWNCHDVHQLIAE